MKKLLLTIAAVIFALTVSGQNSTSDKLYANIEGASGVIILPSPKTSSI